MNVIRHARFLLLALVAVVLILPGAAVAQDPGSGVSEGEEPIDVPRSGEEAAPDQIIVKYREDAGPGAQDDVRSEEGLEKKDDLDLINGEVLEVEDKSVEEAISDLEGRSEVEYAERDYIVYPTGYRDESRFGDLWGLDNAGQEVDGGAENPLSNVDVNGPEASAVTQGDENLVVAVIDDGVDFSHPDLAGRQWVNPGESGSGKERNGVDDDGNGFVDDVNGWDFVNKDGTVHDENRDLHGTHVSGTIAASVNGEGVVGVAPNTKIMALKFIGTRFGIPRSGGLISDAIKAIEYATKMGAKISNNSWGGASYSQALKDAIGNSGMLFVASAGNSGTSNDTAPMYPASYDNPNILSVAAIDNGGNLAKFSNYGTNSVDISAPGVSVLSSVPKIPDMPAGALSSVGSSGKAVTAGFGVEEIGEEANRTSFMKKAFEAVGRGNQPVVLIDDDASDSPFGFSNVRPTLRTAIQAATGGTAPDVINVPYGGTSAPVTPSQLSGKTVVWATGQTPISSVNLTTGAVVRNLTPTDRRNLTEFLNGGGKLILTGRDALYLNESDAFVTETLRLEVQSDLANMRIFNGASGTAFAGESYKLNSTLADPDLHDALTPTSAGSAVAQGVYPGRAPWEFLNGTSMAAPHATGTAALAASINSTLLDNPATLKKALMDGSKEAPATLGKTVTGNMVDARKALTRADTTKPQLNIPSDIVEEATSKDGAVVNFTVTATDDVDGEVSVRCASETGLKPGDTFPIGTTEVSCSAKDEAGNEATGHFNVKVQDTTEPRLSGLPSSDLTEKAISPSGASVTFPNIKASDTVDGDVPVSCASASGLVSGDTFPVGTTEVSCSAKDSAGNEATGSFGVKVSYDFNGFFSPVDNEPTFNRARAGSAVPVKFTLGGNMGLGVFSKTPDGSSYPKSARAVCESTAPVDPVEETVSASSSGLSYDETTGQYTYVWKTSKSWAGTCRQLVIKFNDGEEYRAFFRFPS